MLLSPFYDMIIRFCGHKIDQAIYQCKDQHRTSGTADEQSGICHAEQQEHPADQWKCHGNMKHCHEKRKEKYHQDLTSDLAFYFAMAQSYFLHDLKTILVFVSFRDLFVVDDHRCTEKEK